MKYKSAVIVLVGAETASRRWVDYEIHKAWNEKHPLVGIRIHGLKNLDGATDRKGANPFANVKLENGLTLESYVMLHEPSGITSQQVYASIKTNIESWVTNANKRS